MFTSSGYEPVKDIILGNHRQKYQEVADSPRLILRGLKSTMTWKEVGHVRTLHHVWNARQLVLRWLPKSNQLGMGIPGRSTGNWIQVFIYATVFGRKPRRRRTEQWRRSRFLHWGISEDLYHQWQQTITTEMGDAGTLRTLFRKFIINLRPAERTYENLGRDLVNHDHRR